MESIKESVEVKGALEEIGIDYEDLIDILIAGEVARDSCTNNNPRSSQGIISWSAAVRALREKMIPKGWRRELRDHLELTISPDGKIAIYILTGDERTANEKSVPSTLYPKGENHRAFVHINGEQIPLFPLSTAESFEASRKTWVLLRRRVGNAVVAELSLPLRMDKKGNISSWSKRILLETIQLDELPPQPQNSDDHRDIEVQVVRRDK
jgi:hypothetical protein